MMAPRRAAAAASAAAPAAVPPALYPQSTGPDGLERLTAA